MTQTKIEGKFYPLTPEVAQKLREANLTTTEWKLWSYLITLDPFGDRYQELPPLVDVLAEVGISKASFYRAIARFQELELFDFQAEIKFRCLSNKKKVSAAKEKSQQREKNLTDEKKVSAVRQKSQQRENQPLELLPEKDSISPQTIQIIQTPQTVGGEEKNEVGSTKIRSQKFSEISEIMNRKVNDGSFQLEQEEKTLVENSVQEKVSPRVVQNTTKSNPDPIPPEVKVKLEELGVPLDAVVKKCIWTHHISQVWGAINHIEETWETINNPRGVFLYQVPRQQKEKPFKNPLTPEFWEWYNDAISKGLVQARPAEHLPLDQFREPKVYLRDGRLMAWRKVAAGEASQPASPEQMVQFFQMLRCRHGQE